MTATIPRLLFAAAMLGALATLVDLCAACEDREAAGLALHEGVDEACRALRRLMAALDLADAVDAFRAAGNQEQEVWMDCPDADTLREWAQEWSRMAGRSRAVRLERYSHTDRESRSGRFRKSEPCDVCGKPVGTNYYTDGEVCGGSDGPGFYLCERKRCIATRDGLTIEERRGLYERGRAAAGGL